MGITKYKNRDVNGKLSGTVVLDKDIDPEDEVLLLVKATAGDVKHGPDSHGAFVKTAFLKGGTITQCPAKLEAQVRKVLIAAEDEASGQEALDTGDNKP